MIFSTLLDLQPHEWIERLVAALILSETPEDLDALEEGDAAVVHEYLEKLKLFPVAIRRELALGELMR